MTDLPEEHIPSTLRFKEEVKLEVRYGVGITNKKHEAGMIAGPFEKLSQALEEVPLESTNTIGKIFIFKLPEGQKMYKWRGDRWRKHKDCITSTIYDNIYDEEIPF